MRRNKIVAAMTAAAIFASSAGVAIAAVPSIEVIPVPDVAINIIDFADSGTGNATVNGTERTEEAEKNAADVTNAFLNANNDAKSYFGENSQTVLDIQAAAGLMLGEEIVISEVQPFSVTNYTGDSVQFSVSFPTLYTDHAVVAVLIGVPQADGSIQWHVVQGVVNGSGSVTFILNSDIMDAVAGGNAVIAVASSADSFAE